MQAAQSVAAQGLSKPLSDAFASARGGRGAYSTTEIYFVSLGSKEEASSASPWSHSVTAPLAPAELRASMGTAPAEASWAPTPPGCSLGGEGWMFHADSSAS